MKADDIKKLCEQLRQRGAELAAKSSSPEETQEWFNLGLALLEAHLVNQARIADTLHGLLIHVRQHQGG